MIILLILFIQYLVAVRIFDPKAATVVDQMRLHAQLKEAVLSGGRPSILKKLTTALGLSKPIDMKKTRDNAFLSATIFGDKELAERVLPHIHVSTFHQALELACLYNQESMIILIIQKGGVSVQDAVFAAVRTGKKDIFDMLMQKFPLSIDLLQFQNLLKLSLSGKNNDISEYLISELLMRDIHVDITVFDQAVQKGNFEMLKKIPKGFVRDGTRRFLPDQISYFRHVMIKAAQFGQVDLFLKLFPYLSLLRIPRPELQSILNDCIVAGSSRKGNVVLIETLLAESDSRYIGSDAIKLALTRAAKSGNVDIFNVLRHFNEASDFKYINADEVFDIITLHLKK